MTDNPFKIEDDVEENEIRPALAEKPDDYDQFQKALIVQKKTVGLLTGTIHRMTTLSLYFNTKSGNLPVDEVDNVVDSVIKVVQQDFEQAAKVIKIPKAMMVMQTKDKLEEAIQTFKDYLKRDKKLSEIFTEDELTRFHHIEVATAPECGLISIIVDEAFPNKNAKPKTGFVEGLMGGSQVTHIPVTGAGGVGNIPVQKPQGDNDLNNIADFIQSALEQILNGQLPGGPEIDQEIDNMDGIKIINLGAPKDGQGINLEDMIKALQSGEKTTGDFFSAHSFITPEELEKLMKEKFKKKGNDPDKPKGPTP